MLNTIANLDYRKKLEEYVDNCQLNTPEEVARLFKEYTLLVWDYKLLGKIYDFYPDDIVMHVENGDSTVGVEQVMSETLDFTASIPDNESWFVDIFAEGSPEEGYSFIQSTRCVGTSLGHSSLGPATGRSLSEGGRDCIGLCECRVEKIDGRWKIVEEWMVRSGAAIAHVMTPDSEPVSFESGNYPLQSKYMPCGAAGSASGEGETTEENTVKMGAPETIGAGGDMEKTEQDTTAKGEKPGKE